MPSKTKEINSDEKIIKKSNIKKDTTKEKKPTKKASTKTKKVASKAKSTTKKAVAKKDTAKKASTKKSVKNSSKEKVSAEVVEYYDLPYRYNETIVKILYQTPDTLFVYWDISDKDRENYVKQYGENFFNITRPVLIIHNDTMHYSFEIPINDFANSWYLHVNDSKSDYKIELGRRPINNENIKENYIYISSSNRIESPNDHILFNNSQKMVYYRNVKTNQEIQKPISSLFFMKNMGKIYDIYDLYQELYKNEDNLENLSNLSSNTSSQFK